MNRARAQAASRKKERKEKKRKEKKSMHQAFTLWLTGLSGAGKSTLAHRVEQLLRARQLPVEVLDGDVVRTHLSKGLGFSAEDRATNIQRIAFVCNLLTRNGVICIAAAISPYRETRAWAREHIGDFVEVYVRCPLAVCRQRDVKGLYRRVAAGEIRGFTGVDDPYEEPEQPELVLETDRETVEESVARIFARVADLGYLAASETQAHERRR
ncbi:MAG TPA: adenylyl-sulfate kinase [Ktedonobacteraceae bacterium]